MRLRILAYERTGVLRAARFRRGVKQGISGFAPALRSGEECDLWARLRSAGPTVLRLEAAVLHDVRRLLEPGLAGGSLQAEPLHSLKRHLDRERDRQRSP